MALSQPKFLDIPFANSSNQRTDNIPNNDTTGVGNASWEQGFPPETMIQIADGGVPPRGQDMNGILNQICKILQYIQTGTLFKYNSAFANSSNVNGYPKGALVLSTDKVTLWRNTVEGNKTNPDSGGAGWVNFLADLGLYLPLAGGTMTGQIKSTYASVPISFINLGSGVYRDIQAIRSDVGNNYRLGCVRFATTSTTNVMTFGASDGINSAPSGVQVTREIGDGVTAGAVTVTVATTPVVSDDSKQVATTGYVKDCLPVSIGSGVKPTYTNASGVLTASSSTVGSADTPVYMSGGEITTTGKSFSSYLPLVGGTSNYMTGTIYSSASGAIIRGKNSGADVGYQSQTNGNYGIYDYLNEGWGLIFAGSNTTLYSRRGANINYIAVRDSGLLDTSCNQLRMSDGTYANSVITIYNESTTQNRGSTILIGAANQNQATPTSGILGGAVYVGSGESSGNLYKALGDIDAENAANNQSTNYQHPENLFLASDLSTDIFVRCQNIAERNLFRFDTDKLVMFDTGVVRGTQPQTDQFKYIQHSADEKAVGSGNALSEIRFGYTTGKRHQIEIRTSNDSSNWYTGLGVYTDAAGTKAYTYAPTPDASDSSTKIATTEWVKTLAGAYLPLAGGTMTGQIKTSYTDAIVKTNDTGHLTFCGGSGYSNGASIFLSGKSESSNTGLFRVRANDGTNTCDLLGQPDGTLTWSGAVVTASDDSTKIATTAYVKDCVPKTVGNANTPVYVNSSGVVTSTGKSFANYLPLSGGTMTGNITKKYANLTKGTNPNNDTWHTDLITLDSGGTATANRLFELRSAVGRNGYNFLNLMAYDYTSGSSDSNTLTVGKLLDGARRTEINSAAIRIDDHKIMRNATNGWMRLTGGSTDNTGGGSLLLYGKEASSHQGQVILQAHDGTNSTNLSLQAASQAVLSTALKVAGGNNAISNTGLTVSGTNANYSVKLQSTGFTKGTSNTTTYRGTVEFYGNTMSKWQDRAGLLEFSVVSNKSTAQLVAYNVTAAENTNTCAIGATVDASGNAATFAPTPAAGDNTTKIATTAWVTTAVTKGANMPPGTIVEFAGTSAPSGWLYCNGAAVSRTTYAALFSAIGTGYGTGNGSSTFNLPDFRNRVPQGGSSATDRGNIAAGLPNITGTVHGGKGSTASGAFTLGNGNVNSGEGNKTQGHWFSFDANDGATAWNSNSAGIYGNSTTVQPPAVKVMFIIKT